MAAAAVGAASDADRAVVGLERCGLDAGLSVRRGEGDLYAIEDVVQVDSQPILDAIPGSGDLNFDEFDGARKCLGQY